MITDQEKTKRTSALKKGMTAMAIAILMAGGTSCSRKVITVPVERIQKDTIREIRYRTDSIYERDSIMIEARGDTIIKEHYRLRECNRQRVDTVYRIKVDTVPVVINDALPHHKNCDTNQSLTERVKSSINSAFNVIGVIAMILLGLYLFKTPFPKKC